ncbi:MAG: hypothetical protein ACOZAR_00460 [Patescibacteria group bacterium]
MEFGKDNLEKSGFRKMNSVSEGNIVVDPTQSLEIGAKKIDNISRKLENSELKLKDDELPTLDEKKIIEKYLGKLDDQSLWLLRKVGGNFSCHWDDWGFKLRDMKDQDLVKVKSIINLPIMSPKKILSEDQLAQFRWLQDSLQSEHYGFAKQTPSELLRSCQSSLYFYNQYLENNGVQDPEGLISNEEWKYSQKYGKEIENEMKDEEKNKPNISGKPPVLFDEK